MLERASRITVDIYLFFDLRQNNINMLERASRITLDFIYFLKTK
jgi:hypothetical protein